MNIQEYVIKLLKAEYSIGKKFDYSEIASKVRTKMNSKTSARAIRWYASKFKIIIAGNNAVIDNNDIEEQVDVSLNLENNADEIDNWEKAEDIVIEYEKRNGRQAKKITDPLSQNNDGYDVISEGQNNEIRHIEVKSKMNKKFAWLQLTTRETEIFNIDPNYFIYLVEGNCLNPEDIKIAVISRSALIKMAKFKTVVRFSQLIGIKREKFNKKS